MTKISTQRNNNYTTINNTIVRDNRLSWKAKGIFLYAFSRPGNWEFYIEDLIKHSTDGERATKSGLRELEEFGYLKRKRVKSENGKFDKSEWIMYETPEDLKECLPQVRNAPVENARVENVGLLKKEGLIDISKDISKEKSKAAKPPLSEPSFGLASHLLKKIKDHSPNFKQPNLESWALEIDRMIRIDKRSPEEIHKVIDWATQDSFWRKNILSGDKLRKKFDALALGLKETPSARSIQLKATYVPPTPQEAREEALKREIKPKPPMSLDQRLANMKLYYDQKDWQTQEEKIRKGYEQEIQEFKRKWNLESI